MTYTKPNRSEYTELRDHLHSQMGFAPGSDSYDDPEQQEAALESLRLGYDYILSHGMDNLAQAGAKQVLDLSKDVSEAVTELTQHLNSVEALRSTDITGERVEAVNQALGQQTVLGHIDRRSIVNHLTALRAIGQSLETDTKNVQRFISSVLDNDTNDLVLAPTPKCFTTDDEAGLTTSDIATLGHAWLWTETQDGPSLQLKDPCTTPPVTVTVESLTDWIDGYQLTEVPDDLEAIQGHVRTIEQTLSETVKEVGGQFINKEDWVACGRGVRAITLQLNRVLDNLSTYRDQLATTARLYQLLLTEGS